MRILCMTWIIVTHFHNGYLIINGSLSLYDLQSPIEELFRVSKTFLNIRPVHLQRENRIKAHVLVCYIALILLRTLQLTVLKDTYSFHQIIDDVRNYNCAMLKKDFYFVFNRRPVIEHIAMISKSNAKLETFTLNEIKNLFKGY